MLTFLGDWLAGRDTELLAESLNRFVGHDIDNLTSLQTDLARFVFLLGGDDGDHLFGGEDQQR